MEDVTFVEAVEEEVELNEEEIRGEQSGDDYRGEEDADQ